MPLLRIVPDDTNFDFMRFRRISFPMSALLSIVAIVLYFTHGLNFGIDFKGGTLIEVQSKRGAADIAAMRATLSGSASATSRCSSSAAPADVLIRVASSPAARPRSRRRSEGRGALGDDVEYRRVEVVGPRVSGELLAYGMIGLMLAIIAILIYLWFRFEWQFALGAMIANVHDLVLTIGFMSMSQIDFDLTSIAALLTILGYSLNDTVVIYDRIREMLRRYKKMPMTELLNVSINSTLSRSIITHVTVTLALARAVAVRRPGDPQLHRDHDVRRRAGRHLHVDLHRGADPDLSRRRRPRRDEPRRAGARRSRGSRAAKAVTDAEPAAPALRIFRGRRRSRPTARADSASPACRTAARCCACRTAIWAWPVTRPRRSTRHRWRRSSPRADGIDTLI